MSKDPTDALQEEISGVVADIKKVEAKITTAEQELAEAMKTKVQKDIDYWRAKEAALRKDKEQLRTKEEQLRNKEAILLQGAATSESALRAVQQQLELNDQRAAERGEKYHRETIRVYLRSQRSGHVPDSSVDAVLASSHDSLSSTASHQGTEPAPIVPLLQLPPPNQPPPLEHPIAGQQQNAAGPSGRNETPVAPQTGQPAPGSRTPRWVRDLGRKLKLKPKP